MTTTDLVLIVQALFDARSALEQHAELSPDPGGHLMTARARLRRATVDVLIARDLCDRHGEALRHPETESRSTAARGGLA